MIKIDKLCNEVCAKIEALLGTKDWLFINYGSRADVYDETRDWDVCVYAENISFDERKKIAEIIEQVHLDYGLKLDTDMKYINKTAFDRTDIDILKKFTPFPLENGRVVLSPINFEDTTFLDSHDMRMRLLLNIFTSDSVLFYGKNQWFNILIKEMYDILVSILLRTSADGLSFDEMISLLYEKNWKDNSYKGFLGYDYHNLDQRKHIEINLKNAIGDAVLNGEILNCNNRYFLINKLMPEHYKIVYITGPSGSGTSSLGRLISSKYDVNIIESDDLTMYETNPPFQYPRPLDERVKLMKLALSSEKLNVIVGSINDWGNEFIKKSSIMVFLYEKFDIRKKRIETREKERFGDRLKADALIKNNFDRLISWTKKYDYFDDARSLKNHARIYDEFNGIKFKFSKGETTEQIFSIISSSLERVLNSRLYTGKMVQIMAMSQCPNNCKHCFVGYNGSIPFKELEAIMSSYTDMYRKVILNGTELLMDEKYISLCEQYNQDFIYTNGKLLTKKNREMIKTHGITRLSISLHYGIQEKISKASIEEVSNIIRNAVSEGFKVRVLCTLSKDNYKLVPEIADYIYSLGATGVKFINLIKEGKGENYKDVLLSTEEIKEFFELLHLVRKKYDKNEFYISRNGGFGDDKEHKNNFVCPAAVDWVTILPDHSVHPCNGLLYEDFSIGYWDESGIYIDKEFKHKCNHCTVLEMQTN